MCIELPYQKVSSSRFRYDNWIGNQYISIFTVWDFDKYKPKLEWEVIGYCKAEHLPMREDKGRYAILLERVKIIEGWMDKDRIGEQVWLHIDYLSEAEFERSI